MYKLIFSSYDCTSFRNINDRYDIYVTKPQLNLSADSLQQSFDFSPDLHYGLRRTAVVQLVTTNSIFKTFFPGITELVNNIQHSVGEIQHFCVLKDDGSSY